MFIRSGPFSCYLYIAVYTVIKSVSVPVRIPVKSFGVFLKLKEHTKEKIISEYQIKYSCSHKKI